MEKESKALAWSQRQADLAPSEYLRQRILEDSRRKPVEAAADAVKLCSVLETIQEIFARNEGRDPLAKRLQEDLARLNIDTCYAESKQLLIVATQMVELHSNEGDANDP